MAENANSVWEDGPAGAPSQPDKARIRAWGTWLESFVQSLGSNASVYVTKADLIADLSKIDKTLAWVVQDTTLANNGIYQKVGASGVGSWNRVGDLPYSFIVASDVGAGTPNAIQATTSIPTTESALILLNIFEASTASPVTVSFNGGSVLTIKSNSGNDIAAGGLVAGMQVLGRISGATFRLASDQASAALLAQVESLYNSFVTRYLAAFANDAAASASVGGSPITGALYFNTTSGLLRVFNGTVWQNQSVAVANGDITTPKLADAAVTDVKLAANWADLSTTVSVTPLTILAMGQSNAIGNQGGGLGGPFADVTVWNNTNDLETLTALGSSWIAPVLGAVPFNTAAGPINNMMAHAAKVIAKVARRPVRMVLVANGGQSIDKWVNAANVKGAIYNRMRAILTAAGISTPVDVFLWHQGEADNGTPGTYQARWNNLIAALTADGVIDAGTAIALGETAIQYTAINPVLKTIADADARAGLARLSNLGTADSTHFRGAGLVIAGTRLARAAGKSASTRYGFFANPIPFNQRKVMLKDDGAGSTTLQKVRPEEVIRSDRRPSFAARMTVDQACSTGVFTKLPFSAASFNIGGYYDEANSRWTPPQGIVELSLTMLVTGMTSGQLLNVCIYKNGDLYLRTRRNCVNAIEGMSVSAIDDASGTDYYEAWVYAVGSPVVSYGIDDTLFYGKML